MYFGRDANEALNGGRSPLLRGVLMASAMAMALGIINLFGLETPAALAAATLVN